MVFAYYQRFLFIPIYIRFCYCTHTYKIYLSIRYIYISNPCLATEIETTMYIRFYLMYCVIYIHLMLTYCLLFQAHGISVMYAFSTLVDNLSDPDYFRKFMRQSVKVHHGRGISIKQYQVRIEYQKY